MKKNFILLLIGAFLLSGCSLGENDDSDNTNSAFISAPTSVHTSQTTSEAPTSAPTTNHISTVPTSNSVSTSTPTTQPTSQSTSSVPISEHTSTPTSTPTSEVPTTSYSSSQTSSSIPTPKYVINFDLNGGSSSSYNGSVEITEFSKDIFFFDCIKEGWNFRGWSYNGVKVFDEKGIQLSNPPIADTMTFVAMYSQTAKMTIVSNLENAGNITGEGEYQYNTYVDVSAHPNQGYVFVGWYYQDTLLSNTEDYKYMMWSEDVTLEARFKLASFLMNVHTNNEDYGLVLLKSARNNNYLPEYQEYRDYTTQVTISAYSKTDVRFLGWYDTKNNLVETNAVCAFTMPNYNYILEAKWNYFTVSYNLNGGTNNPNNPVSYTIDSKNLLLYEPTRQNYDFLGWQYKSEYVTKINPLWIDNVELNAIWKMHEYTITYNLDGGVNSPSNVSHYNIESGTIMLSDPTKEGYGFYGWYLEPEFNNEVTEIIANAGGDIVLYAKFLKLINIILDPGEGLLPDSVFEVGYGKEYALPVPTAPEGYEFDYWTVDDIVVNQIGIWTYSPQTLTLKAVYKLSGLNFVLSADSRCYIVSSYSGIAKDITIPDEYRFKPVREVASNAFKGCSSLTSIIIPNSITSIGNDAFYGCSSLESITLPFIGGSTTNKQYLGYIFGANSCSNNSGYVPSSLKTITIGDCCISIPNYAFYGCSSLTSITIPNSVTSIGSQAFEGCSSLTSIVIPDSVTSIGDSAFHGCSSLESITLPFIGGSTTNKQYLGYIFGGGDYSYNSSCVPSSLKAVIISDCCTSIPSLAFYGCSKLTSVTVNNNVTSIGEYAFSGCSSLTSIVIPDSVTSIGKAVFSGCSSLKSITLPFVGSTLSSGQTASSSTLFGYIFGEKTYLGGISTKQQYSSSGSYSTYYIPSSLKSVTITGGKLLYGAFYNCSNITSVTIDSGVASIGEYAFYNCSSLTSVTIPDGVTSIGNYAFYKCSSLTSIVIPDSVTSIGRYAFLDCSSLTSITIPDSVTSIDGGVFRGCSKLTIYCETESKPSGWHYNWNPDNCPVVWGYTGG